ncbi:hypothetical protein SmB9_18480 [Sphingosinicella microcystinivorans]|uniref:Uncharacterized protein n=1 Tax=Sphingosinicella microcystinivorans TaxID=335406 RepID=A0AAD1D5J1_SPHMI|nr:hypothetical protein SmB9_18480 [Sphingosinicella microcystinivorans]
MERFATLPYANYVPVPWFLSARWLIPAGQLALLVITLAAASWSLLPIICRWQGCKADASVARGWVHHATRATAVAVLLAMASWCYVMTVGLADLSVLNGGMDVPLIVLQVTTAIATFGLVVLAAWDFVSGWAAKGWRGRFGSLLLLVGAGIILYISVAFHLVRVSLHY